jgi:hypothetical protein
MITPFNAYWHRGIFSQNDFYKKERKPPISNQKWALKPII